jgi:hypothetical protein
MPRAKPHNYTQEQLDFVKENKVEPRLALTEMFNAKFGTNLSKVVISGLCKRKGWSTGRTGFFSKGSEPWNTGTKGVCKGSSTSFKKGSIPPNIKPLGHERICSEDGIILIKVPEPNPYTEAKTRYRPKHHVVWEKHNGPVDQGMVIRFISNNKMNCDISNLEVVTKAVNLRMNNMNYANLPGEIKPTAKLHAQLEVATFALINKQRA